MGYRFTRTWGRASVVVGAGVFLLALLLALWLGFSEDDEFERFSVGVRIMAFLVVSLVGLLVGGTMIVAGQMVCVLLDQRELLAKILEALTGGSGHHRPLITKVEVMNAEQAAEAAQGGHG